MMHRYSCSTVGVALDLVMTLLILVVGTEGLVLRKQSFADMKTYTSAEIASGVDQGQHLIEDCTFTAGLDFAGASFGAGDSIVFRRSTVYVTMNLSFSIPTTASLRNVSIVFDSCTLSPVNDGTIGSYYPFGGPNLTLSFWNTTITRPLLMTGFRFGSGSNISIFQNPSLARMRFMNCAFTGTTVRIQYNSFSMFGSGIWIGAAVYVRFAEFNDTDVLISNNNMYTMCQADEPTGVTFMNTQMRNGSHIRIDSNSMSQTSWAGHFAFGAYLQMCVVENSTVELTNNAVDSWSLGFSPGLLFAAQNTDFNKGARILISGNYGNGTCGLWSCGVVFFQGNNFYNSATSEWSDDGTVAIYNNVFRVRCTACSPGGVGAFGSALAGTATQFIGGCNIFQLGDGTPWSISPLFAAGDNSMPSGYCTLWFPLSWKRFSEPVVLNLTISLSRLDPKNTTRPAAVHRIEGISFNRLVLHGTLYQGDSIEVVSNRFVRAANDTGNTSVAFSDLEVSLFCPGGGNVLIADNVFSDVAAVIRFSSTFAPTPFVKRSTIAIERNWNTRLVVADTALTDSAISIVRNYFRQTLNNDTGRCNYGGAVLWSGCSLSGSFTRFLVEENTILSLNPTTYFPTFAGGSGAWVWCATNFSVDASDGMGRALLLVLRNTFRLVANSSALSPLYSDFHGIVLTQVVQSAFTQLLFDANTIEVTVGAPSFLTASSSNVSAFLVDHSLLSGYTTIQNSSILINSTLVPFPVMTQSAPVLAGVRLSALTWSASGRFVVKANNLTFVASPNPQSIGPPAYQLGMISIAASLPLPPPPPPAGARCSTLISTTSTCKDGTYCYKDIFGGSWGNCGSRPGIGPFTSNKNVRELACEAMCLSYPDCFAWTWYGFGSTSAACNLFFGASSCMLQTVTNPRTYYVGPCVATAAPQLPPAPLPALGTGKTAVTVYNNTLTVGGLPSGMPDPLGTVFRIEPNAASLYDQGTQPLLLKQELTSKCNRVRRGSNTTVLSALGPMWNSIWNGTGTVVLKELNCSTQTCVTDLDCYGPTTVAVSPSAPCICNCTSHQHVWISSQCEYWKGFDATPSRTLSVTHRTHTLTGSISDSANTESPTSTVSVSKSLSAVTPSLTSSPTPTQGTRTPSRASFTRTASPSKRTPSLSPSLTETDSLGSRTGSVSASPSARSFSAPSITLKMDPTFGSALLSELALAAPSLIQGALNASNSLTLTLLPDALSNFRWRCPSIATSTFSPKPLKSMPSEGLGFGSNNWVLIQAYPMSFQITDSGTPSPITFPPITETNQSREANETNSPPAVNALMSPGAAPSVSHSSLPRLPDNSQDLQQAAIGTPDSTLAISLASVSSILCGSRESIVIRFTAGKSFRIPSHVRLTLWVNMSALVEPNLPPGTPALDLLNARRAIANAGVVRLDNVTLLHDRPLPDPPLLSMPAAIVTSVRVGSAASGVASSLAGNPIMAIQAARTSLILQIAQCDLSALDEGPDRFSYPIGVPLVLGSEEEEKGLWIGAALLNPGLCLGALILHFALAALTSKATEHSLATAKAMTFFPALQSVVILLLFQPTVQASTVVFRSLATTPFPTSAFVIGAVGACWCIGFLVWLMLLTVWKRFSRDGFGATLVPFPAEEKPHCLTRFLIGSAEWVDRPSVPFQPLPLPPKYASKSIPTDNATTNEGIHSPSKQHGDGGYDVFCRQYFLYFDAYRPSTVWYMCIEVLWTIGFGILDGWGPLSVTECKAMMLASTVLFGLAFLAIVLARPYIAPFELLFALVLSALQAASAAATLAYAFANADIGLTLAGWGTTAATYALLGKSVFDLIVLLNDIRANLCTNVPMQRRELLRQTAKTTAAAEAAAEAERARKRNHSKGGELEVPLLGVPQYPLTTKANQSIDHRNEDGASPQDYNPLWKPTAAQNASSPEGSDEDEEEEEEGIAYLSPIPDLRASRGWNVAPDAIGVRSSRRGSYHDRSHLHSDLSLYPAARGGVDAIPWLPLDATEPPNSRLLKRKNRSKRKSVTVQRKFANTQIWI